jgi:hypothetical protein
MTRLPSARERVQRGIGAALKRGREAEETVAAIREAQRAFTAYETTVEQYVQQIGRILAGDAP